MVFHWRRTDMQSVEHIFTSSTLMPFARLFFAMWEFPAISCLIWRYRPRLSPIPLLHLPPGNDLTFLSLIKISAGVLLIPVWCLKTDHLVVLFLLPAPCLIVCPCGYLIWYRPPACLDQAICHCVLWTGCLSTNSFSKLLNFLHWCWVFCAAIGFTHHPLHKIL